MYNGIGLETARGSGTNGYVQRNLSFLRKHKDRVDYKSEEELKKLDEQLIKQPNKEILDHERKRKVELKCMEMQVLMEEQGYSAEDIEKKVTMFREMLVNKEGVSEPVVEKDASGRPIAKESHQIAQLPPRRMPVLKRRLESGTATWMARHLIQTARQKRNRPKLWRWLKRNMQLSENLVLQSDLHHHHQRRKRKSLAETTAVLQREKRKRRKVKSTNVIGRLSFHDGEVYKSDMYLLCCSIHLWV